jgi:hypothetical protein
VAGRRRIVGGFFARRVRAHAGAGQHVAGLLRRGAQEQVPEAGERGALLFEKLHHVAQGVDGGFQGRVLVLGERRVPGPLDEAFEIVHAQPRSLPASVAEPRKKIAGPFNARTTKALRLGVAEKVGF